MEEDEIDPTEQDPATQDSSLSDQEGNMALCAGPILFPMGDGADGEALEDYFQYPKDSQVGAISLETELVLMQQTDPLTAFILDTYDQLALLKGGEGSEAFAAFLSNFMPPMRNSGDERRYYFKLYFGEELTTSYSGGSSLSRLTIDGEVTGSAHNLSIFGSEIPILAAPKSTTLFEWGNPSTNTYSPSQAAQNIISEIETITKIKPWLDWLIFGAQVLSVFVGCGVAVGAIRVAATVGARIAASVVLAFEVSEGVDIITGFVGGKGPGYNPLKEAFKFVGNSVAGQSGDKVAEHTYNTLNLVVGFGGKIGVTAGGLYAGYAGYSELSSGRDTCQPVQGAIEEQVQESQGGSQETVF